MGDGFRVEALEAERLAKAEGVPWYLMMLWTSARDGSRAPSSRTSWVLGEGWLRLYPDE